MAVNRRLRGMPPTPAPSRGRARRVHALRQGRQPGEARQVAARRLADPGAAGAGDHPVQAECARLEGAAQDEGDGAFGERAGPAQGAATNEQG
eukprot:6835514-Prymnesium_polylepis.1